MPLRECNPAGLARLFTRRALSGAAPRPLPRRECNPAGLARLFPPRALARCLPGAPHPARSHAGTQTLPGFQGSSPKSHSPLHPASASLLSKEQGRAEAAPGGAWRPWRARRQAGCAGSRRLPETGMRSTRFRLSLSRARFPHGGGSLSLAVFETGRASSDLLERFLGFVSLHVLKQGGGGFQGNSSKRGNLLTGSKNQRR